MKINKLRSILYGSAKLLGDVNAIDKGKIKRRIFIRIVGKFLGRLMGKI